MQEQRQLTVELKAGPYWLRGVAAWHGPRIAAVHMLVYADGALRCNRQTAWEQWQGHLAPLARPRVAHDVLITALIETGRFESAVADALCSRRDEWSPALARLRTVSEALGTAAAASWDGDRAAAEAASDQAVRGAAAVPAQQIPEVLQLSTPEGYAFYSLYPESYAEAVAEWARASAPPAVLCVGLRGIGTSLSAIAAGALRRLGIPVRSWTLRPRGHPFDRRVDMTANLAARLDLHRSVVLVIDEGPGLSGSSMTGAAAAFAALGLADDRIVLVPSWNPPVERLASAAAQARWPRHPAIVPSFDGVRRRLARDGTVPADALDLGAGAWRAHLAVPRPWPAVHPQHERRKYLVADGGGAWIARFAGLGTFGSRTAQRADLLNEESWSPRSSGLRGGFLRLGLVRGRLMMPKDVSEPFLRHAAAYVAWLRQRASGTGAADLSAVSDALRTNAREALGDEYAAAADALAREAECFSEPATAVDGRLMPHEWIACDRRTRWIKTDALDHHRDHFLPGCTDAAWDVAGALVELAPSSGAGELFVDEYVSRSGDAAVRRRLPFFRAAYAAFRCGYAGLAAGSLEAGDARPFAELHRRYRDVLRATLAPRVSGNAPSAG